MSAQAFPRPWGTPALAALGVLVFLATAVNGATDHASALLLRACAVVGAIAVWPKRPAPLPRRHLVAPALAVFAVAFGVALAPNRGLALQPAITVLVVVLVYLALAGAEEDRTAALVTVAAVVGSAHGVWALAQRIAGDARGRGGFFNPNDLAAFIAPLLVLLVALAWAPLRAGGEATTLRVVDSAAAAPGPPAARRGPTRALAVLGAVTLAIGLAATGSRSGLAAAALGLAVLAGARRPRWALVVVALAAALVAATPSLRARWTGSHDPYAYGRAAIWRASAELALERLPFGAGLSSFEEAMRVHGVPVDGPVRYPKLASNAHDEVLNAAVELGLVGVVAVLAPAVWVGVEIRRRRRALVLARAATLPGVRAGPREPWREPGAMAAMLVALAVPALLSASLHVLAVALVAAVWAAHLARAEDHEATPRTTLGGGGTRRWTGVLGALVLVAALPGAVGHLASLAALRARGAGDLARAERAAALARAASPWRLGLAMLDERLRVATGADPVDVAESLLELGGRFPWAPAPLEAAARLLRQEPAARAGDPTAWRAIATLSRGAAERDPRNALAWATLGFDRQRAGQPEAAEAALERAIAEEPRCARALAALADIARGRGEAARADELAARAHEAAALSRTVDSERAREVLSPGTGSASIPAEMESRDP